MKIHSIYKFPNGNIAVFDSSLKQVPKLQGTFTEELHRQLTKLADEETDWNGLQPLISNTPDTPKPKDPCDTTGTLWGGVEPIN
tara:strand:+ start:2816 stop:3067 length:252 start_codon:yes stop_codon:yes gene_type:complete